MVVRTMGRSSMSNDIFIYLLRCLSWEDSVEEVNDDEWSCACFPTPGLDRELAKQPGTHSHA